MGGKICLFERTLSHIGGHNGKVGGDNHFVLDVCYGVYDMYAILLCNGKSMENLKPDTDQ